MIKIERQITCLIIIPLKFCFCLYTRHTFGCPVCWWGPCTYWCQAISKHSVLTESFTFFFKLDADCTLDKCNKGGMITFSNTFWATLFIQVTHLSTFQIPQVMKNVVLALFLRSLFHAVLKNLPWWLFSTCTALKIACLLSNLRLAVINHWSAVWFQENYLPFQNYH